MLRPRKAVFAILMCAVLTVVATPGAGAAEYKAGEVIVKYKEGVFRPRLTMTALYDSAGVETVKRYPGIMQGIEHLILKENISVPEALSELRKNDSVEYAQPNYILHALPVELADSSSDVIQPLAVRTKTACWIPGIPFPPGCDDSESPGNPSDPENPSDPAMPGHSKPELKAPPAEVVPPVADPDLSKSYGLAKIGAPSAWTTHRGSKDFIVADIDTGIDYNHEDLAFNVWRNPHPSEKKDVIGFDFIHNDGLPYDDNKHGTHTAGTIGAVGGNGLGFSGVTQRVSLMSLKFLAGDGSGTTADAIRAIDYAVAHGAKVLSNSWGGSGDQDNQALQDAINRARDKDVLFVAAAGNDGKDNDGSDPSYPAAFNSDNIVSVAATDESDGLAYFSNFGKKTTHLAAPGDHIYSTIPGNKYTKLSGTSMACPHVAGAAALLWSFHRDWNYKKVKEVLLKSVDPIAALAEKTVSGGRLNIKKAFEMAFE